jgi:hypothetical protein
MEIVLETAQEDVLIEGQKPESCRQSRRDWRRPGASRVLADIVSDTCARRRHGPYCDHDGEECSFSGDDRDDVAHGCRGGGCLQDDLGCPWWLCAGDGATEIADLSVRQPDGHVVFPGVFKSAKAIKARAYAASDRLVRERPVAGCRRGRTDVVWTQMEAIDVDEIAEVNFPDSSDEREPQSVEVVFKDGDRKTFRGAELPEVLAILNHWTPPTA